MSKGAGGSVYGGGDGYKKMKSADWQTLIGPGIRVRPVPFDGAPWSSALPRSEALQGVQAARKARRATSR